MQLREFLKAILPSKGTYYTAQQEQTKPLRQFKHDSIEDAALKLLDMTKSQSNCYIATGSFKNKRTQADCRAKKAWYIDIDCKPGKDYDSKALAMAALKEALKGGLPQPSIIIDSGNGFHIYWVIAEEVDAVRWRGVAEMLDHAVAALGLNVDPTSTKDSARILRAPETLNWKDPKRPIPCEVKIDTHKIYSYPALLKLFEPYKTVAKPSNVIHMPVPQGMPDDLWAGLPEGKANKAQDMIDQCPLFGEAIATGGKEHLEPLWRGLIQTLVYVDDGEDYIHAISDQHPDYNPHHVAAKYKAAFNKKDEAGPYLCQTLAKHSTTCQTCPYWGTIKTPLALSYGTKGLLPYPYRDGAHGVELYDPDEDEWAQVINYHVSDYQIAQSANSPTYVKFVMDGEQIDSDMVVTTDNKSLSVLLAHHGLSLNDPNLLQMRRLMVAWTQQLRNNRQVHAATREFGWCGKGFHYGGIMYAADGTETPSFKTDVNLYNIFSPHGDIGPWQKCANHILSQPRHAVWCMLAASFGSPLMKFTGATGAVLSVVSQDTGTGKSTAMRVAQGVWGHPMRGMFMIDDTTNLVGNRMGVLNNLPGFWDEVREREQVHQFIKNIFRMGQGQEKKRLTSNITERESGGWSTMLIVASNEALRDHIEQQVGNSDAGAVRVFELYADAIQDTTMNNDQAQHMYLKVEENFGHAGAKYAKWLAMNKDKAKQTVQGIASKLNTDLKGTSDERYWIASMSCMLAGAAIATSLGICAFDMKEFKEYLIKEFLKMRSEKYEEWETPQARSIKLLVRFLHEHKDQTVKSDLIPSRGKRPYKIFKDAFKQPVVVRVATDSAIVRIIKEDFKDWMYERMKGAGYGHVIKDLEKMGAVPIRGSVDAGTSLASSGRQMCLDFPMNAPSFKAALKDWLD